MPALVRRMPDAHVDDVLDYGFDFSPIFPAGDDVSSFDLTVPDAVAKGASASTGQVVSVWLGPSAAGTYRLVCDAVSAAGRKATIEADLVVIDPD